MKNRKLNKKGKISLYLHLLEHGENKFSDRDIEIACNQVEFFYTLNGECLVPIRGGKTFFIRDKYIKGGKDESAN